TRGQLQGRSLTRTRAAAAIIERTNSPGQCVLPNLGRAAGLRVGTCMLSSAPLMQRQHLCHLSSDSAPLPTSSSKSDAAIPRVLPLNEIEGSNRVKYAAYYLDGEANVWWQWLTRIYRKRQQFITWDVFERELLTRFGTSDYRNYNEALARIRQTGNLREYIKEFERLACRVRDWPEEALVGTFIGGLKFDLAAEVRLERPDTMHAAMKVARRRDDHLTATRKGRTDARYLETQRAQPNESNMVPSGRPPDSTRSTNSTQPPGSEVKHLTPEEIKRRREKGLCFKCDEKFTPGHHCKQAFVIHVIDPNEEEPEIEKDWEQEVEIGGSRRGGRDLDACDGWYKRTDDDAATGIGQGP
ncbi:Unknown protein, partial [Striga hermonthica]